MVSNCSIGSRVRALSAAFGVLVLVTLTVIGTVAAMPAAAARRHAVVMHRQASDSGPAVHHDTSPPLRSIAPLHTTEHSYPVKAASPSSSLSDTRAGSTSRSRLGPLSGPLSPLIPSTELNFAGSAAACGCEPGDPSGAVGASQYVQLVNSEIAVYSKTGTLELGPEPTSTLWRGFFESGCELHDDGDGTVLYDALAQRWIVQQFDVESYPYLACIAVSKTSDATGEWYRYGYKHNDFPDYPKLGVWPDAYYTSYNRFQVEPEAYLGPEVCALQRSAMLKGESASQQCFQPSTSTNTLLPATVEGSTAPPEGEAEWFAALSARSGNTLSYWKFHVDWSKPENSTLTGPTNVTVTSFAGACAAGANCIPQAETSELLEGLGDRLLFPLQYRNFGSHESLVASHAVVAGSSVGMRWYELRPSGGSLSVYQQGTYAPDSAYRWMGSIAMDHEGDIGLGYSVSSGSLHPQIRYTGRLVGDPLGTMPQGEGTIYEGAGSSAGGFGRWGDYSEMTVDPSNECTFWYVNQYEPELGAFNWATRIGSFRFPSCVGAWHIASSAPAVYNVDNGVACASTTSCVEVGSSASGPGSVAHRLVLAQKWNGSELRPSEAKAPSGSQSSELAAVACPASESCVAVGNSVNAADTPLTLAEQQKGGAWSVTATPNPAEAKSSVLSSVACTSTTACTAVGYYTPSAGTPVKTLAERWNGTEWKIQSTPNVAEATNSELSSVSCSSSSECVAVGHDRYFVGGFEHWATLVERWNGTEWSIVSSPNPTGARWSTLLGVSCAAASHCTAVGYSKTEAGVQTTLAEQWTGGAWAIRETPNPVEGTADVLAAVSCVSSTLCVTTGHYKNSSGATVTLVERWYEERTEFENSANAVPGKGSELLAVGCPPSSELCVGVGRYTTSAGSEDGLAEAVAVNVWGSVIPQAGVNAAASAVSCVSPTACVAVGRSSNGSAGSAAKLVLAEKWNGSEWQPWEASTVSGAQSSELSGLSCPASEACVAVGSYVNSAGTKATLAEKQPGVTAWTVTTTPNPAEAKASALSSVSCSSKTACTAVGSYTPSAGPPVKTLAERWNGSEWTIQSTPNPAGATGSELSGVSCPSSSECVAVGHYTHTVEGSEQTATLVERWNGTEWSIASSPNPTEAAFSTLLGVSCSAAATCTATGDWHPKAGVTDTLAERWTGGAWTIQSTPSPAYGNVLSAVACVSATSCTALGRDASIVSVTSTLVETWNGTEWAVRTTPNPPAGKNSELSSISCTTSEACMGVGKFETNAGVGTALAEGNG